MSRNADIKLVVASDPSPAGDVPDVIEYEPTPVPKSVPTETAAKQQIEFIRNRLPAADAPVGIDYERVAIPNSSVPAVTSSQQHELVSDPAPAADAVVVIDYSSPAIAKPVITAGMSNEERYLAQATREYQAGAIDQPLWTRAAALAPDDPAKVLEAYLRARATALRVADRATRQERADLRAQAIREARIAREQAAEETALRIAAWNRRGAGTSRRRMVIAATLGLAVVVVGVVAIYWSSQVTRGPNVASGESVALRSAPATGKQAPAVPRAIAPVEISAEDESRNFMTRIQELKNAENWNVVILIASAWTRKQPGNVTAWSELTLGYANMRQFEDALGAATKAVQLAPKDALLWRSLGQVNLDLDDPVGAVRAFEEATRWNEQDVYSFAQAGILNTRLGRLPEARIAFAKALALNPDDADARCGETWIAQKQARPKEADTTTRPAKPSDGRCRDVLDRSSPAAAPKSPAAFTVAPVSKR